ncbi:MAG TPA: hypothetical protein PLN17_06835 [Candidatus Cloacimonas sp.]|nr:hypothetical protein [Candidatus Cloacimonas sp.]MDD2250352.1 hypothetical protein [Candidatus Cloacimonadota bacterium]MCK9165657.1 hypothetical protein [Candidatus Cloacimonas sp.]MDD3733861.1 hypothetical protein [Candidatus Cloacimonadota bacterium]MDD3870237.1 hypothetical protein [Candidatus Cloacimonadota bacterium]
MKQEITRKMVEMALILKEFNGKTEQTVVPQEKSKLSKVFKHVYCCNYEMNVLKCVKKDSYYRDLLKGHGGELRSSKIGSAPKFNSIISSAALVVNTFAPWKDHLGDLTVEVNGNAFSNFISMEFEYIAKTKNNSFPNLDVWLENNTEVLAIECKFCEFLGNNNYKKLQGSYRNIIKQEGYTGTWIDIINAVTDSSGKGIYQYFDVVQIIKHYFGIINCNKPEKNLIYLYWHPENKDWNKIHPYDVLEKELEDFSQKVSGATDVHFYYLNFNDLWNQWESNQKEHIDMLRDKYSVCINPEED